MAAVSERATGQVRLTQIAWTCSRFSTTFTDGEAKSGELKRSNFFYFLFFLLLLFQSMKQTDFNQGSIEC